MIKNDDWLREKALKVYEQHKGKIWTSSFVVLETMLISKKFNMECEQIVSDIYQLFEVRGLEKEIAYLAASYIDDNKIGVFDAFHAACSQPYVIISSDHVYDEVLGLERFKLES